MPRPWAIPVLNKPFELDELNRLVLGRTETFQTDAERHGPRR